MAVSSIQSTIADHCHDENYVQMDQDDLHTDIDFDVQPGILASQAQSAHEVSGEELARMLEKSLREPPPDSRRSHPDGSDSGPEHLDYGTSEPSGTPSDDRMRRKLRFFFMNPIQKWQAKRRFPYKLALQVIKIILVTVQICLFARYRYGHVEYARNSQLSFFHLFVNGWDPSMETPTYPPSSGPIPLYIVDGFYDYIDYTVNAYARLEQTSIGQYYYAKGAGSVLPLTFCKKAYEKPVVWLNDSFVFDDKVETQCIEIMPAIAITGDDGNFSSRDFFSERNFNVDLKGLVSASLEFSLKSVNLRPVGPFSGPECYRFDISLNFETVQNGGHMLVDLDAEPVHIECRSSNQKSVYGDNHYDLVLRRVMNILVILVCFCSLILCLRAVILAQSLKRETRAYFRKRFDKDLSFSERLEFLNVWYVSIVVNDILLLSGCILKDQIENKVVNDAWWDFCSVLLGTGNLFVWFGVLRYLGFFRTYNILIVTLQTALPNVFRFLLCAALIYCGFTFAGWLIFGPYHFKFGSLSTTSECLFSLLNGDDMFETFKELTATSPLIWWYSRIYLYSFISLFIYIVLSLFIALIMDSYETIKSFYKEGGGPKSQLQEFILQCDDPLHTGLFRVESESTIIRHLKKMLFRRQNTVERERLIQTLDAR